MGQVVDGLWRYGVRSGHRVFVCAVYSCEFLCVLVSGDRVIVRQGGKTKKDEKRLQKAKTTLPESDFTPFVLSAKKQRSPAPLYFKGFRALSDKKEEPRRLYQILRGYVVEYRGVEPLASTMRMSRATNCANTPYVRRDEFGNRETWIQVERLTERERGKPPRKNSGRMSEGFVLPTALIPRVLSWVFFHMLPVDPGAFFRHAVFDVKTDDCYGAYMGGLRPTNCANTPFRLR